MGVKEVRMKLYSLSPIGDSKIMLAKGSKSTLRRNG
jgi:hypothetical protein